MRKANAPASRKRPIANYRVGSVPPRYLLGLIVLGALLGSLVLLRLVRRVSADTTTPVSIPTLGSGVTQDFNTLVLSGTGTLAANTPAGWGFSESGTNGNTTYTAGTGSSNTG